MKLLRLTTTDSLAVFDNDLHDELILKPNSKIALQNLTMDTTGETITIDNQNRKVYFSITPDIVETIILPNGTYNKDNFTTLNNTFQDLMNGVMAWYFDNSRRYLGTEWLIEVNNEGKLQIEMKYSYIVGTLLMPKTDNLEFISNQLRWIDQTTLGTGINTHYSYDKTFCSRGQGYIRTQFYKLALSTLNANKQGFIIGLMTNDPSTYTGKEIPMADITYGIWTGRNSGKYMTIENGNLTNTLVTVDNFGVGHTSNDSQEVSINGASIELNIYKKAEENFKDPINLFRVEYDNRTQYYPVVILRGGYDYTRLVNVRYTPSPFNTITIPKTDNEDETLFAPPQQSPVAQICYLNFESSNVAQYFGFKNQNNPFQPDSYVVSEPIFVADEQFDPQELADAYLVEMLNMKLESYDGYVNQRKNILAVIPKNNNDNGLVQYESPYLSMIDLNNPKEISIRNIKCRIVKNDYTPVSMFGLSSMTVIFD